jgi:glycopeptide antibiotics resistance protein
MMRIFIKAISFVYFALLFYIFFLARRRPHPSLEPTIRPLQLTPFYNKYRSLRYHLFSTPKEQWNFYTDLFGNILLFIPLAFILFFVFDIKRGKKIILISFVISICVEVTQFILGIGVADIDDVILNTTGACIGTLIIWLMRKSKHPVIQKTLLLTTK